MTVTLANGKSGNLSRGQWSFMGSPISGQVEIPIGLPFQGGLQSKVGTHPVERGRSMEHLSVAHSGHPNQSVTGWGPHWSCMPALRWWHWVSCRRCPSWWRRNRSKLDVALVEPPREVVRGRPLRRPRPPFLKSNRLRRRRRSPTANGSCGGAAAQPVQRQVETRVLPQAVQRDAQPVVETVRPQEQIQPNRKSFRCRPSPLNRRRFTRRSRSCGRPD